MLPLVYKQPLGWSPDTGEDLESDTWQVADEDSYLPRSASLSHVSSTINKNSRRHHIPGWIARPRNAFILFRCEYSQAHCRRGRRIRRPPGTSTEPSLSKRAAIAWSQMTKEEKEPYMLRAEEERIEHARKHPEYRFRPQRRGRYNPRRSMTTPLPQSGLEQNQAPVLPSSVPSGHAKSLPLISNGCSPDLSYSEGPGKTSVFGWNLPPSCDMPRDDLDYGKSTPEVPPMPCIGRSSDSQISSGIPEPDLKGPSDINELLPEPVTFQTPTPLAFDHLEPSFFEYIEPIFWQDYQSGFPLYVMPPKSAPPPVVDSDSIQPLYCTDGSANWPWNLTFQYNKNRLPCSVDTCYDDIPVVGMAEGTSNFDFLAAALSCRY